MPTPTAAGGVAAWNAVTLDPGWKRSFTDAEIAELADALEAFRAASPDLDLTRLTLERFPLPTLTHEFDRLRGQLIDGQGVAAYEGFPVEGFSIDELRTIWLGVSMAIGVPVPQSHRGDLIGDVRDLGTGISGATGRGYTSNSELNFHSDASDVSGLFFLRTAKSGGESAIASSTTVHDLIADRHPELLALLYQPMPVSWQGNGPEDAPGWYDLPVFGRTGDDVACAFVRTNIVLAHQNTGAPPLNQAQQHAVQTVADVAKEDGLSVRHQFDPGAMFFVNNHTVLHLRTAFEDWDEEERKRHLLRVWISPPNSRRLPDSFASFFEDLSPGAIRGGYRSRTGAIRFSTV